MTDRKADILTQNLANAQRLRRLDLYLKGYRDLSICLFTQLLSRASKLTDSGITTLTKNIALSRSIDRLRVDLEGYPLYLSRTLMSLSRCTGLKDPAVISLSQNIPKLTLLKSLEIVLVEYKIMYTPPTPLRCNTLSEKSLVTLCQSLEGLSHLIALELSFPWQSNNPPVNMFITSNRYDNTSDGGALAISRSLCKLSLLQRLHLVFTKYILVSSVL